MPGPGIRLSHDFYRRHVGPLLAHIEHSAALLGAGSEVLGFDDQVSTDHDFGPRLQIFLPAGADHGPALAALTALPQEFHGYPVYFPSAFADPGRPAPEPAHRVQVTTPEEYFTGWLGVDPARGMALADWLLTPTQTLACLTGGAVFHDPARRLAARREALAWYPDDVWRYALAAGWLRISQEQAFVGRTGSLGDEVGAAVLTARLARDLIRLAFLIEQRWAPYGKWLDRGFRQLALGAPLRRELARALRAPSWREKEAALCAASTIAGVATNHLELATRVDPQPHRYYDRDIRVVDAEGFTTALTDAITDPQVLALLARLGRRAAGTGIPSLPGTVDQAADNTDILTRADRCRALAPALGLPQA